MANPLLIKILQGAGAVIIEKPLNIIERQLAASNERKARDLEQKLRHEDEEFMQNLALENRRLNAEIDDQISARELERQKKLWDIVESYQKRMAECGISIGNSVGLMSEELRDRAIKQLETIHKKFSEDSWAREIMKMRKSIENLNQYIAPASAKLLLNSKN